MGIRRAKAAHRRASVSRPREARPAWHILTAIMEMMLIVGLLALIALACFAVYKRVTESAFFPLKRVILVEPLVHADPHEITDVVRAYGESDLLHVNVAELVAEIGKISWVKDVTVDKKWPDAIEVKLTEREPVVRWGSKTFLDGNGVQFSLPDSPALQGLFTVRGPEGYEAFVLDHYRLFLPWLLSQGIAVESITLDPRLVWHVGLGKIDVILGRDHLSDRLRKLAVVNRRVIEPYRAYIHSVDLRYQDGFSVRWKEGVTPKTAEAATQGKGAKR
ncbi:MAG: FtsQ-type POTRA domain-containing protein [Cardiobacteriaceae bacterium]|nr:FtsQ-type POTRA domain-containing protein [Cardiobacteriaceae bacterium]